MERKKMTLIAGLVILFGLWIFAGFSESQAQIKPTMDLSSTVVQDRIRSTGFITTKPIPSLGSLVGSQDERGNLAQGEVVYIKLEPGSQVKPGDRFYLARLGAEISHPITKQKMGSLVRYPGVVVILERVGETVSAKIEKSFLQVRYGDLIVPLTDAPPSSMAIRYPEKIKGTIVSPPEGEENITERVVVFIDRGTRDGVIAGDFFTIYHFPYYTKEGREGKQDLPLLRVGEGVVVSVNEETSALLITKSAQAIYIGDTIVSGKGN